MRGNHRVGDRPAPDQVLLDDPLEHRRIALGVPRPFGIDDCNWPVFTDTEAVGLRAQDSALVREAELFQSSLEEFPCDKATMQVAALRLRLIAAEKDVAARDRNADALRDLALRFDAHSASPESRFSFS